ALAGAEFELMYTPAGGGTAQTVPMTVEGGTYTATDLKKGSYTLAETKVPTGYEGEGAFAATFKLADADDGLELAIKQGAATFAGDVQKTAGAWTGAGVENARIPGSMSLAKVEAGTGTGLAGAEFQLVGPDGFTATLTTGSDGKASASGLAWGAYSLIETKAPAGYQLGAEPYSATFAIGAENLAVDLGSVENAKTSISLAKTDGNGSPLAGAHLKLAGAFADGEREKEWVSDGTLKNFKTLLVVGEEYTLTEDGAVAGYEALPGSVVFKLMQDGKIELSSNPAYADGMPAAVLDDGSVALSVRNMRLPGTVKLAKVDADDGSAPLDGAVFGLFDAEGDAKLGEFATGRAYTGADDAEGAPAEPGSLSIAGLEWGGYYLQELSSDGYVIPDARYPFSIGAGTPGMTADLGQVANERTKASFSKVDAAEGDFVAGATLTLSGRFANPEADEVSWTSGTAAFNLAGRLVAGEAYELAETARPDGYLALPGSVKLAVGSDGKLSVVQNQELADGLLAVSIAADGTSLSLRNVEVYGSVELVKSDAAGNPLEGISFELHKGLDGSGGLVRGGLVTGADGKVSVAGLPEGDYAFVETATRDDLVLDSMPRSVAIGPGGHGAIVSVVMENKAFSASLKLDKLDGTSGDALAGAEFELMYTPAGGGTAQTVPMTVEGGTYTATDLKKGSYTLAETKVPTGYEGEGAFAATFKLADADDGLELAIKQGAATFAGDVQKTAGAWTGAGVENARIPGSMSLAKVEAGTGTGLAGAEFQLVGPDGFTATLTTGSDGKASASGLAWGAYSLIETKAPAGYQLGAEPYSATFAIGAESLAVDLGSVENAKTSTSLAKTDDDGSPLAGAHLKLAGAFADGETEKEWASENDAKVFEGLLIAGNTYTLTETDRLGGYLTWSGQVSFKLDDAGKVVLDDPADPAATVSADGLGISLSNARIVASAELTKTRDGAGPLEGVTFDLYAEGADEPLERGLVTDAAGKVRVSGLPEGSYYFVETAAPDDAVVDGTHQTFSIGEQDHGKTVPVTMDNESFKTVASLFKVDQTGGKALAGAQFALSKQAADGSFVPVGSPLATNEHGALAFTLTERGTYRIQETQAAPGYVLDADKPYTATFTVENTAAFQGAELKLAEVVDPAAARAYGLVVENARYEGGKVANERKLGSMALAKVDGVTGAPLAGAEFELTGPDGSIATLSTGADGTLNVEGLAWGTYTLAETKAPAGYRLGAQPYSATFEIGAHNADSAPSVDLNTVGNEPIEISFTKLERYVESCSDASLGAAEADATRPLEGAEFTAYDDEACTRVSQTGDGADMKARSGADGAVSFSPVKAGTHYLKETVVPDGRVSNDTVYRLDVAADGTVERFAPLGEDGVLDAVVNDVHRTDIRIKKVSETDEGKVLPNSTYGLFKRVAAPEARAASAFPGESGLQLIAKAVTDASGYLVFEGVLMDQEYVIEEIAAPDGSLVSKHPIALTFAVGDDGTPRLVSFDDGSGTAEVDENGDIVWKEPQVIVEFSKRDPDGALLAGATLQVVDEAGATVGEPWVSSDGEGQRIEGVLVAGKTYRLVELAAPDGYIVAEDVSFTVEDLKRAPQEGYVQHVEMVDERVPTASGETPQDPKKTPVPKWLAGLLAKTGDAPLGALAAAVALGAAGVAGAVGVRRRRKRS
ncbi:SpaA isopeptide-forming pilin-related protein, partial [Eggerthella guodeyinii]|uniref:SpaA isopeptide-forming pilin-related protein n=1 Tax=Eggerthella guodeyinii TaxID=2690837 RepID=UPI0022A7D4E0